MPQNEEEDGFYHREEVGTINGLLVPVASGALGDEPSCCEAEVGAAAVDDHAAFNVMRAHFHSYQAEVSPDSEGLHHLPEPGAGSERPCAARRQRRSSHLGHAETQFGLPE